MGRRRVYLFFCLLFGSSKLKSFVNQLVLINWKDVTSRYINPNISLNPAEQPFSLAASMSRATFIYLLSCQVR